jgi:hypothetical protein
VKLLRLLPLPAAGAAVDAAVVVDAAQQQVQPGPLLAPVALGAAVVGADVAAAADAVGPRLKIARAW